VCVLKDRSISLVYTSSLYCFALGWLYSLPLVPRTFRCQPTTNPTSTAGNIEPPGFHSLLYATPHLGKNFARARILLNCIRSCFELIRLREIARSSSSSISYNQIKNWLPFPIFLFSSFFYLPALCFLLLILTFISFYCRLLGGPGAGCLAAKQEAEWQLLQMAGCLPSCHHATLPLPQSSAHFACKADTRAFSSS